MKEEFCQYLINKGYSLTTRTGNPSTVYDYKKRIDKVCEWENCSWDKPSCEDILKQMRVLYSHYADYQELKRAVTVNKQVRYEGGILQIAPPKTKAANRTILLPPPITSVMNTRYAY